MEQSIHQYLDLMDAQREAVFGRLKGIDEARLWERPGPKQWSIGENLDHARAVLQSFRGWFQLSWPLLLPFAALRRNRPYHADIDDVYARPGFPLNVGWMWPPKYNPQRPASLAELKEQMEQEHRRVRRFYAGKDERLLGHAVLLDPAIGWLNLVQALRVGAYHDAHHFATIYRLLPGQAGPSGEIPAQ